MGVILAAGKGSRMAPFSSRYPKPLLPVCNKPILVHQIERMAELGIRDVVIVVGHLGYEIARVLGNGSQYGVSIRFVEQKEILGIAHAVSQLEKHVDRPFLLFLGDIFFDTDDLSVMIDDMREREAAAILAVKEERDPDAIRRNFAVILDDDGTVRRVIEKPRYIKNRLKGCGLYLFDLPIFDAIRRTPRTAMRDEYEITDSIQILIDDGYRVTVSEVIVDDVNVSYPQDLLRCNLMQLRKRQLERLVAETASLVGAARIEHSVIGRDVSVTHPIRITNSLVFDECRIDSRLDLDCAIVTTDALIDCRNQAADFAGTGRV
ncbi:MAG: NTP transferase domain-containing protein [Acidobacteria bacterium]|nr:NTP transferase domain-containing protein [Acidobacteriota bacterium]